MRLVVHYGFKQWDLTLKLNREILWLKCVPNPTRTHMGPILGYSITKLSSYGPEMAYFWLKLPKYAIYC